MNISREQRLCFDKADVFSNENSPLRKGFDAVGDKFNQFGAPLLNNEGARTEALNDRNAKTLAFLSPDIFTARKEESDVSPSLFGGTDADLLQRARLLNMQPLERVAEFDALIRGRIPAGVLRKYGLDRPPLGPTDLAAYQTNRGGRIGTLQRVLSIMTGGEVKREEDPMAFDIAREAMSTNLPENIGKMYGSFEKYLRQNSTKSEAELTSVELLLADPTLPQEIRGALQAKAIGQVELQKMVNVFYNKRNDSQLALLDQRKTMVNLLSNKEKEETERAGMTFLDNYQTASFGEKAVLWGAIGLALYSAYKGNKFLRYSLAAFGGYYIYDRFLNGNPNALNDMARGVKKGVDFTKDKIRSGAEYAGIVGPKEDQDKLRVMAKFLEKNQMKIGPAAAGMALISEVKMKSLSRAFTPNRSEVGGMLNIDKNTLVASRGSMGALPSIGTDLDQIADREGFTSKEKKLTREYLQTNNASIGEFLSQMYFELAARKPQNASIREEIKEALQNMGAGASVKRLPERLKRDYLALVNEGMVIAESEHGDKSLRQVVMMLNAEGAKPKERKAETSARIPNPEKDPRRQEEFALFRNVRSADLHSKAGYESLMKNGDGPIAKDCAEFMRNIGRSGVLESPAARDVLDQKFFEIRTSGAAIRDILLTIERLKYAVLVSAARTNKPLSDSDIETMTGPNASVPTNVMNSITRFMNSFGPSITPGGFHNVSKISHVTALLTDPWIGSGPLVAANGRGFKTLKEKLTSYEARFKAMLQTEKLADKMVGLVPDDVVDGIGGKNNPNKRTKTKEFILSILNKEAYVQRIQRAEEFFSQKMANALVSNQLFVVGGSQSRLEEKAKRAITENEQFNLAKEFDTLFNEIVGNVETPVGPGMWQSAEDLTTLFGADPGFDLNNKKLYNDPLNRNHALAYAEKLGTIYLMMVIPNAKRVDAVLREKMRTQVELMVNNAAEFVSKATDPTYERLNHVLILLGGKPVTPPAKTGPEANSESDGSGEKDGKDSAAERAEAEKVQEDSNKEKKEFEKLVADSNREFNTNIEKTIKDSQKDLDRDAEKLLKDSIGESSTNLEKLVADSLADNDRSAEKRVSDSRRENTLVLEKRVKDTNVDPRDSAREKKVKDAEAEMRQVFEKKIGDINKEFKFNLEKEIRNTNTDAVKQLEKEIRDSTIENSAALNKTIDGLKNSAKENLEKQLKDLDKEKASAARNQKVQDIGLAVQKDLQAKIQGAKDSSANALKQKVRSLQEQSATRVAATMKEILKKSDADLAKALAKAKEEFDKELQEKFARI